MENVHKSADRPWIGECINLKNFRDQWFELINYSGGEFLKGNIPEQDHLRLEEECGSAALECPYQKDIELCSELEVPEGVELKTLIEQKADLQKRVEDPQYKSFVYANSKYVNYPTPKISTYKKAKSELPFEPVSEPEIILSVQVFRPEKQSNSYIKSALPRFPVFQVDQEFLVLGSQYLTELRDKIDCISDRVIPGDFSEHPDLEPDVTCKDLYKSGFFYIDGVFYNDMRDSDCRDYSETIIKWSQDKRRGIGPFQKALMEHCQFIDLNIQLGYPYVYIHQGNCEHITVFNDVQMFSHHYCQNRNDYPLIDLKPKKRVLCMACHIYTAGWVVYENKRLPENPFFFCKQCFRNFNYDENNRKIGNFR
ncbi:snRNA-activating protein complex subunit 3, partial [Stegodyphus mimosarum]